MSKKILFIVEGKRDKEYTKQLCNSFGLEHEVFNVQANIHMLYKHLEKESFQLNITDALLERPDVDEEDKEMLKRESPFLYTYLVFDMDPQHGGKTYEENVKVLKNMLCRFNDETDDTVGKLYVNYPMVESMIDYSVENYDDYQSRTVSIGDICSYKELVGQRGASKRIDAYTINDFLSLALINIKKAYYISDNIWEKPDYYSYLHNCNQLSIAENEERYSLKTDEVPVLSSIPLLIVDYKGNQTGFYDTL